MLGLISLLICNKSTRVMGGERWIGIRGIRHLVMGLISLLICNKSTRVMGGERWIGIRGFGMRKKKKNGTFV